MRIVLPLATVALATLTGALVGFLNSAIRSPRPASASPAPQAEPAPFKIRRVVTGHNREGKAVFVSDTAIEPTRFTTVNGTEFHRLWGMDQTPTFPNNGSEPEYREWFPPVGGFRFAQWTIPPASTVQPKGIDPTAARAEWERLTPGLWATGVPEAGPGMHRSNTVDCIYIMSGRVILQLDDGAKVTLQAGDAVIQNGTIHAWHNPFDEPCRLLCAIVGAHRQK